MTKTTVQISNGKESFSCIKKYEKYYIHIYFNTKDAPDNAVKLILDDFNTHTKDNDHIVISNNIISDKKINLLPSTKVDEIRHLIIRSKKKTLTVGQDLLVQVPFNCVSDSEKDEWIEAKRIKDLYY